MNSLNIDASNKRLSFLKKLSIYFEKITNSKHRVAVYILCYTMLFFLCTFLAFLTFMLKDRTFIWAGYHGNQDGISQHYIALSYYGRYLRELVTNFFETWELTIPLYDTSIGMGGDVIQTLSYYVIGDPLTLTSALVPSKYTEILYNFLIVLRLYLAGLSFSALALYFNKNNRFYTLIASMLYVFSSYSLFASVRHPYFSNPMIYFPLIILGAEKIFSGKKPWLYIISVALAGLSNFYFFYMICFLTLIYASIRVFSFVPKGERKRILYFVSKFIIYTVLALMIASVLLIPNLSTTLASGRLDKASSNFMLLYPKDYYKVFVSSFAASYPYDYWTLNGLLPISLFAIFIMFRNPNKNKTQIVFFSICILFMLVPVFGSFLNGMAYVTNRWIWAYCLLVALICAKNLPNIVYIKKKDWITITVIFAIYSLIGYICSLDKKFFTTAIIGIFSSLVVLLVINYFIKNKRTASTLTKFSILILSLLQLGQFAYDLYDRNNYTITFVKNRQALNNSLNAQGNPVSNLSNTFYRYEDFFNNDRSRQYNAALLNGGHSTDCYFSLASDYWFELLNSVGDKTILIQNTQGVDNRTILGALSNIKYFTVDEGKSKGVLPYGYTEKPIFTKNLMNSQLYRSSTASTLKSNETTYEYYENENFLPFGYTYNSYITRSQYNSLSYADRQKALLYNAVVEDSNTTNIGLKTGSFQESSNPLDIEISCNDIELDNKIDLTIKSKTTIDIFINNASKDCETYVVLKNLEYTHNNKKIASSASYPTITMLSTEKTLYVYPPEYTYYPGIKDYSVNMGYYNEAPSHIAITLPSEGNYSFEIEVVQLDLSGYEKQISELGKEHLENVIFSNNKITGSINVSENKLLCLSLPYSKGWTAYVDGKETEILCTGIAFMGIELEEGYHTVEFKYCTPYLKTSGFITIMGIAILTILIILDIRKNKKEVIKNETIADHSLLQ